MVVGRQLGRDPGVLGRNGAKPARAGAEQLHHVRVLLLRHDRRSGPEGRVERQVAELPGEVERQVPGQLFERPPHPRDLLEQPPLEPRAAVDDVDHRPLRGPESEHPRHRLAVYRDGRAEPRRGAERG